MVKELVPQKTKFRTVVKAAVFNPKNLVVLATGIVAGTLFSYVLIPIGIMAYGILCYLDLSSADFVKKVLKLDETPPKATGKAAEMSSLTAQRKAQQLEAEELQSLQAKIRSSKDKIQQLYDTSDDFTRELLGDFGPIANLVAKSDEFLFKAQTIRNYLSSENAPHIQQDMTTLKEKIHNTGDDFAKRQYEQALQARYQHLESLRDIQQVYERLVSQVTNISISLDSMYSRMMKLKTSEDSLASAESDQVSAQLTSILKDVEQLDNALKKQLALPG
jgi:hypothetical protein